MLPTRVAMSLMLPTHSLCCRFRYVVDSSRYDTDVDDPLTVLPIVPLCCRLESLCRWCCRPTACVADPAMLPTRVAMSLVLPTHCLCCRPRYVAVSSRYDTDVDDPLTVLPIVPLCCRLESLVLPTRCLCC